MPALQVRDFPDELYAQLKESATADHRSIAQQTIVAVEHFLRSAGARPDAADKRARLFAQFDSIATAPVTTDDEIVTLIAAGRSDRTSAVIEAFEGDAS